MPGDRCVRLDVTLRIAVPVAGFARIVRYGGAREKRTARRFRAPQAENEPENEFVSRPVSRVLSGGFPLRDGHSSGTPIAGRLEQPTRVTGVKTRLRAGFPRTRPPLFGLAPGGVCRAAPVTSRAVRSYRTFSPLPRRAEAWRWRFVFCGTFPGVAPGGR